MGHPKPKAGSIRRGKQVPAGATQSNIQCFRAVRVGEAKI